jgi:anthranilate synthase/aminodeoxychorismate synthase-like glutamine amidotransferase
MGGKSICRALNWDLSATDVLRLVGDDPYPVALLGAWSGGSDIIGSVPLLTSHEWSPIGDSTWKAEGTSRPDDEGPRFGGGWIGYIGYGASARYLPVPPPPGDPRRLPDSWWGYYDHVLRRDREAGQWYFEALVHEGLAGQDTLPGKGGPGRESQLAARLAELERRAARGPREPRGYTCGTFRLTPSPAEHRDAVRRTVDYVRQGDIFQANICLRIEAPYSGDPLDGFCAAAEQLDPRYAAFLRLGDSSAVASMSPELFLRRTGSKVLSSPIKGTRARPDDAAAAKLSREALECSVKDGAENVMIVDLMRNDLSRVCVPGSVEVPALLRPERHPGVWHLVSDVTGTLAAGVDDDALIQATFPPGSVTGAPKVRALEVIHELEPVPREAYTGAIGYRSPVAGLELNVAIRTFEFHGSRVWLGAGGGITARSVPAAEYGECLVKASPLIQALGGELEEDDAGQPVAFSPGVPQPLTIPQGLRPRPAMGVFTSLRVTAGSVADLEEHLARLEASTVEVYGKRLPDRLRDELAARLAERPTGRLRITARPVGGPLQVTIEVVPEAPVPSTATLRPVIVPGGLGPRKWKDRRLLAALSAGPGGAGPGSAASGGAAPAGGPVEQLLLVDANGDVLETDRGNVFAVIDGILHTPPLDGRLLPGVTRAAVLRLAAEAGIGTKEAPLTVDAVLEAAEEVFVTNSVGGVVGVRSGPVTESLAGRLARRAASTVDRPVPGTGARELRAGTRPLIVLVDNYDSFTYNLAHLLSGAGCQVEVVSNDEVPARAIAALRPDGIVISPGPCAPAEAGISVDVVRMCGSFIPLLGICLGHQAIAVAYGGTVVKAGGPAHGYASVVSHDGAGVLAGLPARFPAARYHSLVVDPGSLPAALRVTARLAEDGDIVMGIRHAAHPVEGLQFHPESILTVPHGRAIIGNFLRAVAH